MLEPKRGRVHVTVPNATGRARRNGISLHRSAALPHSQTTLRSGIPVTNPPRTLDDLRRLGDEGEYRRALRQAEFRRLPIGERNDADGTRSGLEARFIAFCRRYHLPRPEVNAKLGPYTVDLLWRAERLVVETDSYRTHGGAVAFEEDRERALWLKTNGYEVVRVTDEMLDTDASTVAASLNAILRKRCAP
jgi:very-short-patch-repair endonuclease